MKNKPVVINLKFRLMEESVKCLKERYTQLSDMMHKIEEQHVSLGLKTENKWPNKQERIKGAWSTIFLAHHQCS